MLIFKVTYVLFLLIFCSLLKTSCTTHQRKNQSKIPSQLRLISFRNSKRNPGVGTTNTKLVRQTYIPFLHIDASPFIYFQQPVFKLPVSVVNPSLQKRLIFIGAQGVKLRCAFFSKKKLGKRGRLSASGANLSLAM